MNKKQLPSNFRKIDPPDGVIVFDSIMIFPRSSGVLSVPKQYSKSNPRPKYELRRSATNKHLVECNEVLLGSEEHYTVTIRVNNYNDSPAFVYLEKVE